MKASLEVELEDKPGQLRKLLDVLSEVNANITSVTHMHGKKTNSHMPVIVTFAIVGKEALERLSALLRKDSWKVISLGKLAQLRRITVGIVGHIIHTRSVETMVRKVDVLGANVSKFSVNMPSHSGESSALITFDTEDDEIVSRALRTIEEVCSQNNLMLIKTVE